MASYTVIKVEFSKLHFWYHLGITWTGKKGKTLISQDGASEKYLEVCLSDLQTMSQVMRVEGSEVGGR